MQKKCSKCGEIKDLEQFYGDKSKLCGHDTVCKECRKTRQREYFAAHAEIIRERARNYQIRHREKTIAYQTAHRPQIRARENKYIASDAGKMAIFRTMLNAGPLKVYARMLVRAATRAKVLVRPTLCDGCGKTGRIAAHHHDYSKPLEVKWLCTACHALEHKCRGGE